MKLFITPILVLTSLITFGQNKPAEELLKIYRSGNYDMTIVKANEFLQNDPDNIDYKLLLGRALTDKGDYHSAIPYLEFTVSNDHNNSWRKAWALAYLGNIHFRLQDYDRSKKYLQECFDLKATKNVTQFAYIKIQQFGLDDFYKDWKIVESDNFRFHFQNRSDADIEKYISSREEAFRKINAFFESELPKKIDFFVWNSGDDAKKVLRTNLGFADPNFSIVHSHLKQTKGHEMTHIISNYTTKIIKKTELITEGTAVCFDQTNYDKAQIVKEWLKNNQEKVSIRKTWTNWNDFPEELTYPLSGLFVKELIDHFGRDKFIEFFGNQTYENAKQVFGEKLDEVILEFENKMNT